MAEFAPASGALCQSEAVQNGTFKLENFNYRFANDCINWYNDQFLPYMWDGIEDKVTEIEIDVHKFLDVLLANPNWIAFGQPSTSAFTKLPRVTFGSKESFGNTKTSKNKSRSRLQKRLHPYQQSAPLLKPLNLQSSTASLLPPLWNPDQFLVAYKNNTQPHPDDQQQQQPQQQQQQQQQQPQLLYRDLCGQNCACVEAFLYFVKFCHGAIDYFVYRVDTREDHTNDYTYYSNPQSLPEQLHDEESKAVIREHMKDFDILSSIAKFYNRWLWNWEYDKTHVLEHLQKSSPAAAAIFEEFAKKEAMWDEQRRNVELALEKKKPVKRNQGRGRSRSSS